MKKPVLALFLFALLMGLSSELTAQKFPALDKSPMDAAYYPARAAFRSFEQDDAKRAEMKPLMRVLYSRPQKNNRDVFNEVVKWGEVWRAGANESAEILLLQDVMIGDKKAPAGRYTFYFVPNENEWEMILSSDLDGWGAYAYNPDNDVARVKGAVSMAEEPIEAFSIMFEPADDGAHLVVGWDKTVVRFPIRF